MKWRKQMLDELKNVAIFLFYTIRRLFIIITSTINKQLYLQRKPFAVDDKKLHYTKKKIIIQKEKDFITVVLASSVIY